MEQGSFRTWFTYWTWWFSVFLYMSILVYYACYNPYLSTAMTGQMILHYKLCSLGKVRKVLNMASFVAVAPLVRHVNVRFPIPLSPSSQLRLRPHPRCWWPWEIHWMTKKRIATGHRFWSCGSQAGYWQIEVPLQAPFVKVVGPWLVMTKV